MKVYSQFVTNFEHFSTVLGLTYNSKKKSALAQFLEVIYSCVNIVKYHHSNRLTMHNICVCLQDKNAQGGLDLKAYLIMPGTLLETELRVSTIY